MLIAETPLGKPISLYLARHNSPLITHLRTQPLICPSCKSSVIIKSGEKVMPHFAHKSKAACSGFSENESVFHLHAKTALNHWFSQQSLFTELEKNYPQIKRRTDISVQYSKAEFAIEVQCSPISADILQLRSADYRKIGIIPFWILPSEFIQKASMVKLSSFHQQFIRYSPATGQYYLLTYSPVSQSFTIYNHLTPLSKTLFLTSYNVILQNTINFPSFPIKRFHMTDKLYAVHLKMNEKWLLNLLKYRRSVRDPLMRKLYETNLPLFEAPPWIGLMLKNNMIFSCSPMEWQIHLYVIMKKEKVFYKQQLISELKQLIHWRVLHVRSILEPLPEHIYTEAVEELINVLSQCEIIEKNRSGYVLDETIASQQINAQNRSYHLNNFHHQMKKVIIQEYNRR
ncbi:competence protein CoiA [Jeotgalibacillus malaysiensis]|uniref:competence protein CoiA n=1 Tax=Jeotgalibacillus malaysiensis TaxID=1508404 RepID=UPI00384AE587